MAILQYKIREQFVAEFELSPSPSNNYAEVGGSWVIAKVAFRFFEGFPEIAIEREGQEVGDVERLIREIREVVKDNTKPVDFYPLEPDYHIMISRDGSDYEVIVVLDVSGTQSTGVYCGIGPAIHLTASKQDLLNFANDLEKELEQVKQIYRDRKR